MLSNMLEIAGCTIIHAEVDADAMIVDAAIESAKPINTVLVGDGNRFTGTAMSPCGYQLK